MKNKVQEVDAIQAKIVALTKAKFENVKPDSLPRLQGKAKWVLQCSDLKRISQVRYLNTVWEDSEGSIWMESLSLGDNIDKDELFYRWSRRLPVVRKSRDRSGRLAEETRGNPAYSECDEGRPD